MVCLLTSSKVEDALYILAIFLCKSSIFLKSFLLVFPNYSSYRPEETLSEVYMFQPGIDR